MFKSSAIVAAVASVLTILALIPAAAAAPINAMRVSAELSGHTSMKATAEYVEFEDHGALIQNFTVTVSGGEGHHVYPVLVNGDKVGEVVIGAGGEGHFRVRYETPIADGERAPFPQIRAGDEAAVGRGLIKGGFTRG